MSAFWILLKSRNKGSKTQGENWLIRVRLENRPLKPAASFLVIGAIEISRWWWWWWWWWWCWSIPQQSPRYHCSQGRLWRRWSRDNAACVRWFPAVKHQCRADSPSSPAPARQVSVRSDTRRRLLPANIYQQSSAVAVAATLELPASSWVMPETAFWKIYTHRFNQWNRIVIKYSVEYAWLFPEDDCKVNKCNANHLASTDTDNLIKTTKRQNTYQRKLTAHKKGHTNAN